MLWNSVRMGIAHTDVVEYLSNDAQQAGLSTQWKLLKHTLAVLNPPLPVQSDSSTRHHITGFTSWNG